MTSPTSVPARRRRYKIADKAEAGRLAEAGWTVWQITQILNGRGLPVAVDTVRGWIAGEARAERRRQQQSAYAERRRVADSQGRFRGRFTSDEFKIERMRQLATRGASHHSIAVMMGFDFPGLQLDRDQVRYAIRVGRLPKRRGA